MTGKHPAPPQRPASREAKADEQTYLNHGVESLVAQDNPDDSQLGAPNPAAKQGTASPP